MDRSETLKILSVLKVAYPNFYKDMSRSDAENTVALWTEMFAEDDYVIVNAAVKALITASSNPFPPVIGQIREKIQQLTHRDEDTTEEEAWHMVSSVLYHCGSMFNDFAEEEFKRFPPDIQQVVGSPTRLREWANMDTPTLQSVVASNFMRSYKARTAANREFNRLPAHVREFIGKLGTGMSMDRLEDTSRPMLSEDTAMRPQRGEDNYEN